jgi:hypothetical protein
MGKFTFVNLAVASLVIATATVRAAETPTYLYGTSTKTAGPVSVAATTPTSSDPRSAYVVAAESAKGGALEMIAWQDTTTSLVEIGSASVANGLAVKSVAATGLDATRVVTADVDATGALSINTWVIGGTAGIVQQDGYNTGPSTTTAVSIATVSSTEVVTAAEDFSGNLVVQAWTISSGGLPTPIGAVGSNGLANQVAIATIDSGQVITAVATPGSNALTITTWAVDSSGVTYQNEYAIPKAAIKPLPDHVAVAAGSQNVFEEVNGFPSLVTVRSAFVPIIDNAGNVEVWNLDIAANGSVSLFSKVKSPMQDFFEVAACMLPTNVPISVLGDVYSNVHVGWYGQGADDIYNAIKGNTNGITSIGAASAGSDYKVYLLDYDAYFVTGVLTYTGSAANGNLEIRKWSYPVAATL